MYVVLVKFISIHTRPDIGIFQNFIREPLVDDWARLQRYTHRIRAFSGPKALGLPIVDDDVLRTIFARELFHILFPSLHTLDFTVITTPTIAFPLLVNVLSRRLVRLTFTIPRESDPDAVRYVLRAIPENASSLRTLKIDSFAFSSGFELSDNQMPYLHALSLGFKLRLSSGSFPRLMQLQHLQVLSLSLADIAFHQPVQSAFTVLQCVKITARSLDQCCNLISSISSSVLREVSISYDTQAPNAVLRTFFQELACLQGCSLVLDTVVIKHNLQLTTSSDHPFMVLPSTLTPLLTCRRLRILHLVNLGTLDLDDAFIKQAALAWPALEELRLCSLAWSSSHRLTLSSIRELVSRCPCLVRLHMAIDARILPDKDLATASSESQWSSLDNLNLRNSQITDPQAVAEYLMSVAPGLRTLSVESDMETCKLWRVVEHLIKGIII